MYARGHEHGTRKQTATQSCWYAEIEAANIQAVEDAARAEVTRLAQVVGDAVTALPEAAARIAKAATLVQQHEVWPLTSGSYLVGSQSDTQAAHLVTRSHGWHCDCKHAQYRQTLCSHTLAAMLTVKMGITYQPSYELPQAA
jgi:hypothetical protein